MSFILSFLFLQNEIEVIEENDGYGAADWVDQVTIQLENGQVQIQATIAESCDLCEVEWRLGFTSDASQTNPEILISATPQEFWWEGSRAWQNPSHSAESTLYEDQTVFSINDTTLIWTFPLSELPSTMWSSFSIGLYSLSDAGNDDFGVDWWSDAIVVDSDGDLLSEEEEIAAGTNPNDADSDDDGLLDGEELLLGTNPFSCDSDDDGLPDGLERGVSSAHPDTNTLITCFIADRQPSSQTDPLNPDTDGGGRLDGDEDSNHDGNTGLWEGDPTLPEDDIDADQDGIIDSLEEQCEVGFSDDADGDGLSDVFEGFADNDEDGTPNFCDTDDDDDQILSIDESGEEADFDGDGLINAYDTDSDNDGLSDSREGLSDHDCDQQPNFIDDDPHDGPCADSDGDGLTNPEEEACGTDPFNPDSDGDGYLDADECDTEKELEEWKADRPTAAGKELETGCASGGVGWLLSLFLIFNWKRRER